MMWRDCGRAPLAFDVVHASAFPYAWPIVCGLRLARRLGVPFLVQIVEGSGEGAAHVPGLEAALPGRA